MSFISKIFDKKQNVGPTLQEAMEKLRETEEMLEKKTAHCERKIEEEIETARKNAKTNKRVALQALKRKKRLEKQLQQMDGSLTTIEFQREALENNVTNREVMNALDFASKAMKLAQQKMSVDDVHNLMDQVAEQQETSDEISQAMASCFGQIGQEVDEEDLLAELEELEQEDLNRELTRLDPFLDVSPCAPSEDVSQSKQETKDRNRKAQLAF